jgi:hypothetical protein
MSQYKFNKCIRELSDEIWKEHPSMKLYELGYATGMVVMFKKLENLLSVNDQNSVIEAFNKMDDNLGEKIKKLLDNYSADNSKADDLAEAYEEYVYFKENE